MTGLPTRCRLCPRACGADRASGERGMCGADDTLRIARAALHEWEEPPISVGAGSGAVFFSNCPMRCIFCQNAEIACGAHGTQVPPERLPGIYRELHDQGAANINLVTPTHYLPFVADSIRQVKREGFDLPFICNTSGYETVETIRELDGLVDIYLTDFKYWRAGESDAAFKYSRAADYFQVADAALKAMLESVGPPRFDSWHGEERLVSGVVVRHLILPGRLQDSKRLISYLWGEYGDSILYSVMNQYTPLRTFDQAPELNSRVDDAEYEQLLDCMDALGMADYFWQEGGAAEESFIPAFDSTGVLSG
ncbi:MAG: 4Fe-4S cluster-binding domain-containing protein [Eggerthellaceae bacterium]